jgi:hypothetical protein
MEILTIGEALSGKVEQTWFLKVAWSLDDNHLYTVLSYLRRSRICFYTLQGSTCHSRKRNGSAKHPQIAIAEYSTTDSRAYYDPGFAMPLLPALAGDKAFPPAKGPRHKPIAVLY